MCECMSVLLFAFVLSLINVFQKLFEINSNFRKVSNFLILENVHEGSLRRSSVIPTKVKNLRVL